MRCSNRLWLSLVVLAAASPAAVAQQTTLTPPVSDSLPVEVDSLAPERGWLGSLLRKIARRSDDGVVAEPDSGVVTLSAAAAPAAAPVAARRVFNSRRDRLEYESARATAERAKGYRVVVDIGAHRLFVIDGADTLKQAPVATAKNTTLTYGGRSWRFETPRGVRTVLSKDKEPTWTPPDWHFAEIATEYGLKMRRLERGEVVRLRDGTRLLTKGDEVGVIQPGETEFVPLVLDSHIVFDNMVFIPPVGTKHRTVQGELGHFRLKLGDGYQLHGTPYANSIGAAVTHGCVRLNDEDIEWLYENVPVGTKVYLY
jgi:lipoprotein-anchoring transpeptidase ErfK/SrfK